MSKYLKRRPCAERSKAAKGLSTAAKWVAGTFDRLTAPDKEPEKKGNVLLQSYFTSLLSLVLCVGMFMGTSYAWFTSEVNNTSNEIYIGILEVELEKKVEDSWESLSATENDQNITKLFDSNNGTIFWEPGYTAMETVRVRNEGDLAFKYVLNFTDGNVTAPEGIDAAQAQSLQDVAKYFDVWVYNHAQTEGNSAPANYAEITAQDSGWVNAGTLDRILEGKAVLTGEMLATPLSTQQTDAADTYTIALHMKDEADTAVMGHKISLSVKLIAYQKSGENDAFGNGNYDAGVTAVTELETLKEKLAANNANLLLGADMEIGDSAQRLTMTGGVLDGYNKAIRYTVEKTSGEPSLGVLTIGGGTVRNLTIDGGTAGRALYSTKLTSDLLVSNCTLSGVYAFNLSATEDTEFTMKFVDTTFESWTSYANVMKCAEFANCTVQDTLRPYGDTVLTNCTFTDETLDVSKLENGETVKLVNCSYHGAEGVNVTVTNEAGQLKVESEGVAVEISDQKMLVLSGNS